LVYIHWEGDDDGELEEEVEEDGSPPSLSRSMLYDGGFFGCCGSVQIGHGGGDVKEEE